MCWKTFILLPCLFLAITNAEQHSKIRRSKLVLVGRPAELRGSREQRIKQNTKAMHLGIGQILTDDELFNMEDSGILVQLKDTEYYSVNGGATQIRKLRRGKKTIFCQTAESKVLVRNLTRSYVNLFAHDFFMEFHKKLKITSGARSLKKQTLMRTKGSCMYNPNAAIAADSLEESLHVRALAFDVSRRVIITVKDKPKEISMSRGEINWVRRRLIADKLKGVQFEEHQDNRGEIEAYPIEENFCYHIVVFPR